MDGYGAIAMHPLAPWKQPKTRTKKLMQAGLKKVLAYHSTNNGRDPWWNSGARHMNTTHSKANFDRLGLVSVRNTVQGLQHLS